MSNEDFNLPKPIMLTGVCLVAARRYRDIALEKQSRYESESLSLSLSLSESESLSLSSSHVSRSNS